MLPLLAAGGGLLLLAQVIILFLRATLLVYLQGRLDEHVMLRFFAHVLSLPYRFFQQRGTGDLITRIGSNMLIRETLTEQLLSAILDGTLVVAYLAAIMLQAPSFGLIVLTLAAAQLGLLLSTSRRVASLTERQLVAQAETQGYLVEALSAIATLKASGAEQRAQERWSGLFARQLGISLARSYLSAGIDTALTALRTLSPLLLLWVGAGAVMNGSQSLGTMLALQALAAACLMPLGSLVASGQRLLLVGAYLVRIADVVEAAPEQAAGAVVAPQLVGRIDVEHVRFR